MMKSIFKIAALILVITQASCKKENLQTADEKRLSEIAEKYHLTSKPGTTQANAKSFASLDEMEAYLQAKSKPITAKASGTLKIQSNKKPLASSYGDVTANGDNYSATLQFYEFYNDGYPDVVNLSWTAYNYYGITASLSSSNMFPPAWPQRSFYFTPIYHTHENGNLYVSGDYEEILNYNGNVFTKIYTFEVAGTYSDTFVSVEAHYNFHYYAN